TAITHREEEFLAAFFPVAVKQSSSPSMPPMMEELSRIVAAAAPSERLVALLEQILKSASANARAHSSGVQRAEEAPASDPSPQSVSEKSSPSPPQEERAGESRPPPIVAWQMAAVAGFSDGLRARGLGDKDHSALLSLCSGDQSGLRRQLESLFHRSSDVALD